MCAQFLQKGHFKRYRKLYKVGLPPEFDIEPINDIRITPKFPAFTIAIGKDGPEVRKMLFSLIPPWSPEPKVKFATHNARLEGWDEEKQETVWIYEKATWKIAFGKTHCLVPIDAFIEPAYEKKFAGNMVSYFSKDEEPLSAAAIFSSWTNKVTGEIIESFALLTDDPIDYVVQTSGHDRSPVFLSPKAFEEWLDPKSAKKDGAKWVKFLRENKPELNLDGAIDRPLKNKTK